MLESKGPSNTMKSEIVLKGLQTILHTASPQYFVCTASKGLPAAGQMPVPRRRPRPGLPTHKKRLKPRLPPLRRIVVVYHIPFQVVEPVA